MRQGTQSNLCPQITDTVQPFLGQCRSLCQMFLGKPIFEAEHTAASHRILNIGQEIRKKARISLSKNAQVVLYDCGEFVEPTLPIVKAPEQTFRGNRLQLSGIDKNDR